MRRLSLLAPNRMTEIIQDDLGIGKDLAELADQDAIAVQIAAGLHVLSGNVSIETADKLSAGYPAVYVYCDRLDNSLREKFRSFSGTARVIVEARVTNDLVEAADQHLGILVDALTNLLDRSRGTWHEGMTYAGGYEVEFPATKPGGRRFVKTAKIRLDVHININ